MTEYSVLSTQFRANCACTGQCRSAYQSLCGQTRPQISRGCRRSAIRSESHLHASVASAISTSAAADMSRKLPQNSSLHAQPTLRPGLRIQTPSHITPSAQKLRLTLSRAYAICSSIQRFSKTDVPDSANSGLHAKTDLCPIALRRLENEPAISWSNSPSKVGQSPTGWLRLTMSSCIDPCTVIREMTGTSQARFTPA